MGKKKAVEKQEEIVDKVLDKALADLEKIADNQGANVPAPKPTEFTFIGEEGITCTVKELKAKDGEIILKFASSDVTQFARLMPLIDVPIVIFIDRAQREFAFYETAQAGDPASEEDALAELADIEQEQLPLGDE